MNLPAGIDAGLAGDPDDRYALLQAASDLRAHQRLPDALAVLAQLQAVHPQYSRLYQERGHCHVLLRDAPAAIEALREAVRLNPSLPTSWDMLEQLYRMRGDTAEATTAGQHRAMLEQLPGAVVVADSLLADGDLITAEAVIREHLRIDRDNVGALRLLARIRTERDAPGEAEVLLEVVLKLAPDYHAARLDYAVLLLHRQNYVQARQQAELLLEHAPDNRDYLKQLAAACIGLGDHEAVIDPYQTLLSVPSRSATETADLRLWRANALRITGRQPEAIADYHASLAARRDYGVAWFGLANLKTYRFTDNEIAQMRAAEATAQGMDKIYLCFAIGQALESRRLYPESWHYYARGNAVRHVASRYRSAVADACELRLKQAFTAEFFASRADWGSTDAAPIFVLGLPRAGSTLVEQILASHSLIEGTQELTEIGRYAGELCGVDPDCGLPVDPDAVRRLTASDARALGERFLAETRIYRRSGQPFFIDKMPNNFWHIGLIHLILPGSIIIDVRREPMACCFSNLKQLFGTTNQEFAYSIDDIARHYRAYLRLMRHWDAVLPGRVLRVHLEDVVDDLEHGVRRMLDHCALNFEPGCLAFHRTRRSVRTPSSEQVRQPIDRDGLTQWQHYAQWLGPLRDALGDASTGYRT